MAPTGYSIHMYATGTGTGVGENAVASINIPQDGWLVNAIIDIDGNLTTLGDSVWAELSFSNVFRADQNNQNSTILSTRGRLNVVTTGGADTGMSVQANFSNKKLPGIPVQAGDQIHINVEVTNTRPYHTEADLFFVAGKPQEVARQRSR